MSSSRTVRIATRGSALALAQSNMVLAQCREAFPRDSFELKIIKTTGDKLQTASIAQEGKNLPKGLFTKELEIALLNRDADLAVHSLKDLPTELPSGLALGAVGRREDVRDVLLYRDRRAPHKTGGAGRAFGPDLVIRDLPEGAVVATSSTRRRAQLLTLNSKLKLPDIRGNVATRMRKLATMAEIDATVLALAGMLRLGFNILKDGTIQGEDVPPGLLGVILSLDDMLPCVGQGAIGIEVRDEDPSTSEICRVLNDDSTHKCVTAERSFLAAMGGGCQSPVAAFAEIRGQDIRMRAVSFASGPVKRAEGSLRASQAAELGNKLARELK